MVSDVQLLEWGSEGKGRVGGVILDRLTLLSVLRCCACRGRSSISGRRRIGGRRKSIRGCEIDN